MTRITGFVLACACALGVVLSGRAARAAPVGVTIRVVDASGAILPGVRVSLRTEKGGTPDFSDPATVARGETGATGSLRFEGLAADGRYTLVATAPDARWSEFADLCLVNWSPKDVTVTLSPANRLAGVVRTGGKKPVPYARVYARVDRWESATLADKDGAFVFANAPAGQASLYAQVMRKDGAPAHGSTVSVPSNTSALELGLPSLPKDRQACLIVRVTTPGGRPVMHGSATFRGKRSGSRVFGDSFSSGSLLEGGAACSTEFTLPMTVKVFGARNEYGEPLPCGPGQGGPYGPGPREGALQLPAESFLVGRVLGPDGKPLVGIRVRAQPEDALEGFGVWLGLQHGDGVSGPDGTFRIGGLDKRKYALRPVETLAFVGGEGRAAGGSQDVELSMRAAVAPTLTFTDESGKPVRSAIVRVKRPERDRRMVPDDEPDHETRSDAQGQARLEGLDPQVKYKLTAYPPTGREELLTWEIKRWEPRDQGLTFERARKISGVVRDQGRAPVPGARVMWYRVAPSKAKGKQKGKQKPPSAKKAVADAEGRFVLEALRPGRYSLLARRPVVPRKGTGPAPSEPEDAAQPHVVAADSQDVSLLLRMPDELRLRVWAWDKKAGKPTLILLAQGDEGKGPVSVKKRLDKNGEVVVKGLRWNVAYSVWMPELKHGKYVYRTDLKPKDDQVTLRLEDGKSVSGKLVAPKGTKGRKVFAVYPGFVVPGKVKAGGFFEIIGLPPGPWTLRGCGKLGSELIETDVPCEADGEPVITLAGK